MTSPSKVLELYDSNSKEKAPSITKSGPTAPGQMRAYSTRMICRSVFPATILLG